MMIDYLAMFDEVKEHIRQLLTAGTTDHHIALGHPMLSW